MADTFIPKKGLTYTTYGNTTKMSPQSEFTPKAGQTYYTNTPSGARRATTFTDKSSLGAQTSTTEGASGGGDYGSTLARMKSGQQIWDDNLLDRLNQGASSARDSMLSSIQRRLDETRNLAKQKMSNAEGTRNYVVDFINKRYPELQQRVEQQRTNTMEDLSGQETGLQTLYDRANAQARRRSESSALQNRMVARAGNRLGSSFYDETVANNQEELGKTLGASDLERIGKVAAIGTQKTRANQEFNNTINDLDTQKNQATYAAVDEYKKAVQEAEALERAGVLDFGEGQAQAEANLQSRLDSIAQWAQGMSAQKMALDAQYGTNGANGSIGTRLADISGGTDAFISSNAATPAGNDLQNYQASTMALPQTTTNPYIANQGVSNTDDILKRLGLA